MKTIISILMLLIAVVSNAQTDQFKGIPQQLSGYATITPGVLMESDHWQDMVGHLSMINQTGHDGAQLQTRTEKVYKGVRYIEYLPLNWNGHVILFLHGLGERGSDISLIEKLPIPKLIKNGYETDFIIIAPQLDLKYTSWGRNQLAAMKDVVASYGGIPHVTGLSLGGIGTFAALKQFPGYFKSAAVVCGETKLENLQALAGIYDSATNTPTKLICYHGTKDGTISISRVRQVVPEVNHLGGDAKLIEYPGVGHNAWDRAYSTSDPQSYWAWIKSVINPETRYVIKSQYVLKNQLIIETENGSKYKTDLLPFVD